MKLLYDIVPIAIFFLAFKFFGIYVATAVAIATTVIQLAHTYQRSKKLDPMQVFTLATIVLLGGATLLFHDESFIKFKPSVIYWGSCLALLADIFKLKKGFIQKIMSPHLVLPERAWPILTWCWIWFFAFMGTLNLWVALTFDTQTWVNFKLFVTMGLTLIFTIGQGVLVLKFQGK